MTIKSRDPCDINKAVIPSKKLDITAKTSQFDYQCYSTTFSFLKFH